MQLKIRPAEIEINALNKYLTKYYPDISAFIPLRLHKKNIRPSMPQNGGFPIVHQFNITINQEQVTNSPAIFASLHLRVKFPCEKFIFV